MSRTFVSPDRIARAAASIPVRRSLTNSATSRADFPASAASVRTSSATTAKPSPCSSARAASMAALRANRCVCRAIRAMVCAKTPIRSDIPDNPATVDAVGFPLYRRDGGADLFEHAVEALLEEPELVGFRGGRANGEVPLLRFAHHAARAPNTLDERRGNPLERHRDNDEHARFEIRHRVETDAAQLPEHAEDEQRRRDCPTAAVTALECLEILEALLERGGVVVPATRAGCEGQASRLGHLGSPRPRSDAVRKASTRYPSRSIASRPPSSRSITAITPSTCPPSLSTASTASRAEPPVVSTSSTMTTGKPDEKQPSMR